MAQLFGHLFLIFLALPLDLLSGHSHPFDSLTPAEFTIVADIIKSAHVGSTESLDFHYVGLDEPDKPEMLSFLSNPSHKPPPPRRAFIIARSNGKTHEIYVDITNKSLISSHIYEGYSYPLLTLEEQFTASTLPLNYTPFIESVKKRGVQMKDVVCITFSVGWFGETKQGIRKIKILCFVTGETVDLYMRPLEGITIVVDFDAMEIVEYKDRMVVPVPKAAGTDYRASKQKPPFGPQAKPVTMVQPEGKGFEIDGHMIRWANWVFHLSFDIRAGLIISLASVRENNRSHSQSVMYRGFISELFVPYMDPSEEWYYRTFFDAGEYGLGLYASALQPMTDCPAYAAFMDGYYAGRDGIPVKIQNAFCIFERYAGDASWRHTETGIPGEVITEVRPDVSLVVRMVCTAGNYDYVMDWEFKTSGSIKFGVSLTGTLEVKGSPYMRADKLTTDEHGTLVAQNTIGVYHDHFITYYLDLDIDGHTNSFVKNKVRTVKVTNGETPRRSYWTVVAETAKTEADARTEIGSEVADLLIVNANKKTKIGNNVGYRIISGGAAAISMLADDDYPQIRASYSK